MDEHDSRHGTYAGAGTHRRHREPLCALCLEASRRYRRGHAKATRMGKVRKIPTNIVADHIDTLISAGMTRRTIAELAGVNPTTITKVRARKLPTVLLRVAAGILAIQPGDHYDSIETWRVIRRVQALHALGWTYAEIGRRAGWHAANVRTLMHPNWRARPTVTPATFAIFDGIYRDLSMQIPPPSAASTVARDRARAEGWPVPLCWDNIDDPAETPAPRYQPHRAETVRHEAYDEAVVVRVLNGDWRLPCTPADKAEVVARWTRRDPTVKTREAEYDKPSYSYLERLTGWKVDRYIIRQDGAA